MTELSQQNAPVTSAVSAVERVTAMRAALSATQGQTRTETSRDASEKAAAPDGAVRTFADYARVNRDIASVVDNLAPPARTDVASAESAVLSLMQQPLIVVPLPPASQDMVAFVAQVAQSIQRQAALTRAAMSGVAPAVVDAAVLT